MKISILNPANWRWFFSLLCHCFYFLQAKRNGDSKTVVRSWAELPSDLITLIADRLGIVDLLRFQSVCKSWNSAASRCSAEIESSPNSEPWFLLYEENNSECVLLSRSERKYTIKIPELHGATCIASRAGWLLLQKASSIFFFCPFSRSKIDLPQIPNSGLRDHIAAFSSPPTSKDCIVLVVRQNDKLEVELFLLRRGANEWTKDKYNQYRGNINTIKAVVYHDKTFQLYDNSDSLVTFSTEDGRWNCYRIVPAVSQASKTLPFALSKSSFKLKSMNTKLGLAEDVSVNTCGTVVQSDGRDMLFFNENISQGSESSHHVKGAWIEPRYFKIPYQLSW